MKRICLSIVLACAAAHGVQWGGELRFCLRSEPKTMHPLLAADDSSETIRYLTGGLLLRCNRVTQALEPELAASWTVSKDGRAITFRLRRDAAFSDGTPFGAADVAHTIQLLNDPALKAPVADALHAGPGNIKCRFEPDGRVTVLFPAPVAGLARLFDQLAMISARSPVKERASAGPFYVAEYKPGAYVLLKRNPFYWKTEGGRRLPYMDAVRLDIQQNRELELMRFRRGELHLVTRVDPDQVERTGSGIPESGPSLDAEVMWFNQAPSAPVAAWRKEWFRSRNFRRAISYAIHRDDLCRVVYRGHARPGGAIFPPANRFWHNPRLGPDPYDAAAAQRLLHQDGFRLAAGKLLDRAGRPVEFSLITNAGNRPRERMAAMIQQDLARVGIRVNVVTLDFPSLVERIGRSLDYEACLLGFANTDVDPTTQMNVWLSSGPNHPWYPGEPSPATPWEAEIDKLLQAQAAALDPAVRKRNFDRVQEIVHDQAPILYLLYKDWLGVVSPSLSGVAPAALPPYLVWNPEQLWLRARR